jgi:hypothetical protein
VFISLTEKIHFDELVFELKKKWKPFLMIDCNGNILRFKWNHHPSYTFTIKGHEASQPSLFSNISSIFVVGDIFGLVFWPFGSLSKMAPCFKIQTLTKNSHWRRKNGKLPSRLAKIMRDLLVFLTY